MSNLIVSATTGHRLDILKIALPLHVLFFYRSDSFFATLSLK